MTWGEVLNQTVIPGLVTVLLGVLSALALVGVRYLERRLRIDVPASVERVVIDEVIPGAVGYAEQLARRHAKGLGAPVAKLEVAVQFAQQELERRRLPELGRDALVRLIESRLGAGPSPAANGVSTTTINLAPGALLGGAK